MLVNGATPTTTGYTKLQNCTEFQYNRHSVRMKPLMETVCMFVNLWVGAVDDVLVFLHFPGFVAVVVLLTVRRHYRGFDSSILRVLFIMVQI